MHRKHLEESVDFCFLYKEKVMARKSEIGKYF